MKIGLTRTSSKMQKYTDWLDNYNLNYEILDYENANEGYEKILECSGLILTGGVDIYPEVYCDWENNEDKGKFNPKRDGFELNLLNLVFEKKLPVLAICRGMQLINVYFRGSLIYDLWDIRKVNHRKISDTEDRFHGITIFENSLLNKITGETRAEVSSSHHQAVDRLGEGLIINAKSDDGIVEGLEFADKKDKSFMLGIQWHPERNKDFNLPTSFNILQAFLNEAEKVS